MQRRRFITLVGGTVIAWPLAARAQQPTLPIIGWLSSGSPRTFAKFLKAFQQGLREQEFVEGRNVTIEYRWAEGHFDELDTMATELVTDAPRRSRPPEVSARFRQRKTRRRQSRLCLCLALTRSSSVSSLPSTNPWEHHWHGDNCQRVRDEAFKSTVRSRSRNSKCRHYCEPGIAYCRRRD